MTHLQELAKHIWLLLGAFAGWLVATFSPTFPLLIIAIIFMVYDSVTAYKLSRRVHLAYPEKKPKKPKFSSYLFRKVVSGTMMERLILILLAFLLERYVFIHVSVPLSYIVTGVICFEQFWSILENESSCRKDEEGMFWKLMKKITIDKTARHLDMESSELESIVKDPLQSPPAMEG